MNLQYYIYRVKFQITAGLLECELPDESFGKAVMEALEEVNRYYDSTQFIQLPGSSCIDLAKAEEENNINIRSVVNVYRTQPMGNTSSDEGGSGMTAATTDPISIAMWNNGSNFMGYGSQNFTYRYLMYNTTQQISNTMSTDLDFKEDEFNRKLYVNYSNGGAPSQVVVEYIPKLTDVEQIRGTYWTDILYEMSVAYAKIAVGRVRTRYTQDNALWKQDGEMLLTEGKEELSALRERLKAQANFIYPLD